MPLPRKVYFDHEKLGGVLLQLHGLRKSLLNQRIRHEHPFSISRVFRGVQ